VVYTDPSGYDYVDLSIGGGLFGVGGIAGLMIGPDPCEEGPWYKKWFHPYAGGGLSSPGPSGGIMWGFGDPSSGSYAAGVGGCIVGQSVTVGGPDPTMPGLEIGLTTPTAFVGGYYVW
jgi:hypothetical protein